MSKKMKRNYETIETMLDCLKTGKSLPYTREMHIAINGVFGDPGIYVGYSFGYFKQRCPIHIKLAYLAIFTSGYWKEDRQIGSRFVLPQPYVAIRNWRYVTRMFAKQRPVKIYMLTASGDLKTYKAAIDFSKTTYNAERVTTRVPGYPMFDDNIYLAKGGRIGMIEARINYDMVERTYIIPQSDDYYLVKYSVHGITKKERIAMNHKGYRTVIYDKTVYGTESDHWEEDGECDFDPDETFDGFVGTLAPDKYDVYK